MTLTFGGRLESFSVTQARRLGRFLKNGRSRRSSFRPRLNALTLAVAVFSSAKVHITAMPYSPPYSLYKAHRANGP